jgi:hypothetical protein
MMADRLQRCGLIAILALGLAAPAVAQETEPTSTPEWTAGPSPQVIVHPLLVAYTDEFLAHQRRRKHQVTGRDLERMRRDYQRVLTEKLAAEFPVASEPGPRVVRVDAVLLNHELDKSDWLATKLVFGSGPGVRLVAYIRDSQTGAILDRVGITLRPRANRMMKESPGFYWHYMRRVFDRIATRVRWALEESAARS